jgi:FkbM family methyltransferase
MSDEMHAAKLLLEHFRQLVVPDSQICAGLIPDVEQIDLPALRGHLAANDATPEYLLSLLLHPKHFDAIARERRAVAASLMAAVADKRAFDPTTRHAFGVLTAHHERALRRHVAAGRLTVDEAVGAAWDGPTLQRLLTGHTVEVPLVFESTLGIGSRQSAPDNGGACIEAPFSVETSKGSFRLLVSNGVELWRATALTRTEPETVAWLERTVATDSVVYDVGANIGGFSLYAWRLGAAQVVAFEPEPLNFARLTENLRLNKAETALALPIAVSDHAHVARFAYRDFVRGAASPHGVAAPADGAEGFRAGCICQPLDALRNDPALSTPTHLKIDVDGHELKVLAGAVRTLACPTLAHLLVELHVEHAADALGRLATLGFRHTSGRSHGPGVANYIFERWSS